MYLYGTYLYVVVDSCLTIQMGGYSYSDLVGALFAVTHSRLGHLGSTFRYPIPSLAAKVVHLEDDQYYVYVHRLSVGCVRRPLKIHRPAAVLVNLVKR